MTPSHTALLLIDAANASGIPVVRIFHEAPESHGPFDPELGLIRPLEGFEDMAALRLAVARAAEETGFGDERQLRRHWALEEKCSPSVWRRAKLNATPIDQDSASTI
ncbi:hypothetical protein B0H98_107159 [Vreelandella songnenensis]|uniref:Uncharacterized protein n=1 Tax=Vreelandella songnenensis TaxID=1176243 RepID=A0A2T0V1I0_9GAMM|nr:hypothetical protein [Halomonas songnenensis]PRY64014.1 hypothetical protein B0H98_107159 [Halomonas songnenensis]